MSDGLSDANREPEGCDHSLSVAIGDDGEIAYWRCFCGAVTWRPGEPEPPSEYGGESGPGKP